MAAKGTSSISGHELAKQVGDGALIAHVRLPATVGELRARDSNVLPFSVCQWWKGC